LNLWSEHRELAEHPPTASRYFQHDTEGPQHYIDYLKITLLVLLWYNSDVSFPMLGYLNRAKIPSSCSFIKNNDKPH